VALGAVKLNYNQLLLAAALSRQRPRVVLLIGAEPETGLRLVPIGYVEYVVAWKTDGSNVGDILGTRNRCLGMVRKLLTDARETSYWILSSRLTAGGYKTLSAAFGVAYEPYRCLSCP